MFGFGLMGKRMGTARSRFTVVLVCIFGGSLSLFGGLLPACTGTGSGGNNAGTVITPADSPEVPARGFFKGVLPIPGNGQRLVDSFEQAARDAEFVPVWGSGIQDSDFWDLPKVLSDSGEIFLDGLIRGKGLFPLIHFSFMDEDPETGAEILRVPPGMESASLSDRDWRDAYKQAVLETTRVARPLYLSVGNEVNRWYEEYGAEDGDPNGFQNFVTLYEDIYASVKELSPETNVFCVFAREIPGHRSVHDLSEQCEEGPGRKTSPGSF
jgi:hypothetical protein